MGSHKKSIAVEDVVSIASRLGVTRGALQANITVAENLNTSEIDKDFAVDAMRALVDILDLAEER